MIRFRYGIRVHCNEDPKIVLEFTVRAKSSNEALKKSYKFLKFINKRNKNKFNDFYQLDIQKM